MAGDPPSSAGRAPLPPADEDDGYGHGFEEPLDPEDEDRPGHYGAAALGVP